jgi:hypothetical protein
MEDSLFEKWEKERIKKDKRENKTFLRAVKNGSLCAVKLTFKHSGKANKEAQLIAAENGRLDILKYLLNNSKKILEEVLNAAVMYGHLHIVKYLVENNSTLSSDVRSLHSDALLSASICKHLNIVEYLLKSSEAMCYTNTLLKDAVGQEDLLVIKFWHSYGLDEGRFLSSDLFQICIRKGNVEMAEYLFEVGYVLNSEQFFKMCLSQNLSMAKYFYEKDFEPTPDMKVVLIKKFLDVNISSRKEIFLNHIDCDISFCSDFAAIVSKIYIKDTTYMAFFLFDCLTRKQKYAYLSYAFNIVKNAFPNASRVSINAYSKGLNLLLETRKIMPDLKRKCYLESQSLKFILKPISMHSQLILIE